MKILRILVITMFLNIQFTHAMQEPSITTIVREIALTIVGAGAIAEGVLNITGSEGLVPVPKIKGCQHAKDLFRTGVGIAEVGVGLAAIACAYKSMMDGAKK